MSYLPGKPEDYISNRGVVGGPTYILIPNYENWELLQKAVGAIEKNVDCFEPTILINFESEKIGTKGLGFTGSCNLLMKAALADPNLHGVYVVGNDTEVITPSFHHLVLTYADQHPDVGAIMFAERIPDDKYSRIPGGYQTFPIYDTEDGRDILQTYRDMEIPYPMFAFMWIRGKALREVGVLDERFAPGYYDDFDWGVRAWLKGWKSVWVPQLQFKHLRGYTMGKLYPNSGVSGALKFYEKYPWLYFGQDPDEVLRILKEKANVKPNRD